MSEPPGRRCNDCGRDRVEVNLDRDGVWLCLRHYLERHPENTVPPGSAPQRSRPARRDSRPDWMVFRDVVIDALWDHVGFAESIGFREPRPGADLTFRGVIDADCFVGTCPICAYPVGVRFFGTALRMTLSCESGCSEAEVVARIRGLRVRL